MEKPALLKEQEPRMTGTEPARSKEELRRWILSLRGGLSERKKREWDAALFDRIRALGLHRAGTVYCYASVRGEAGTGALIDWYLSEGVRVALPRTEIQGEEKRIRFYYIRSRAELVTGRFHIPEPPPGSEPAKEQSAPVLTPGLAFSEDCSRLGYGGGFYDRFFESEPRHMRIGVCYGFQVVRAMEREAHDRRMDVVALPKRWISGSRLEGETGGAAGAGRIEDVFSVINRVDA